MKPWNTSLPKPLLNSWPTKSTRAWTGSSSIRPKQVAADATWCCFTMLGELNHIVLPKEQAWKYIYLPSGLADSDDWYGGIVVWETVPSKLPEVEPAAPKGEVGQGPIRILMEDRPDEVEEEEEPTLRLDISSLEVLVMEAVSYTTKEVSVSRYKQTEKERNAFDQHFTDIDMDNILEV